MIKVIFEKVKQNWFQVAVIVLLILCYVRLGQIKENTFFTADVVDDSSRRLIDPLDQIERNTENTWQILDDRLN